MITDPIRFIIEDHSSNGHSLVVARSTRTGCSMAFVHAGVDAVSHALHRELGVHPDNMVTYAVKSSASQRKAVLASVAVVCSEYPHAMAGEVRCCFMSDI